MDGAYRRRRRPERRIGAQPRGRTSILPTKAIESWQFKRSVARPCPPMMKRSMLSKAMGLPPSVASRLNSTKMRLPSAAQRWTVPVMSGNAVISF